MGAFDFDDYGRFYLWLPIQHEFNVRRVNVYTGRSDDDLSLSAFEIKVAFLVDLANVAAAKPTVFCCSRLPVVFPVSRRNVLAAHQIFAILGQFHFLPRQYLADRAAALLERVVDADERRSLGHAIALNHGESEPLPEPLGVRIERCATRNKGPELPTEHVMNRAKRPPAAEKISAGRRGNRFLKSIQFSSRLEVALDLFPQRIESARHGDDDRDALAFHGLNDL